VSDAEAERPELASLLARGTMLQRGGRFAVPLPDAFMAFFLGLAAAIDFLPVWLLNTVPTAFLTSRQELVFILVVEGGFLMMQGTLVDIATRLKKRPPVWLIVIIVAAVAIFSEHSLAVVQMAWQSGWVVFLPLLISLAERGTMLWHMPSRSPVEKMAARALIGNRITTGLALFGLMTVIMVAMTVSTGFEWSNLGDWPALAAGAIYFAIAAYDDWRVRGRKFAERPRVLFGFDPIGIEYLEPL
jgi:hypothetical protein